MTALDWEKVAREKKLSFRPSQRSRPASQKQLDYIIGLAQQKGQPKLKLPKTMYGASQTIERLLDLPDAPVKIDAKFIAEPEPSLAEISLTQETVAELRERLPSLSPMTANSIVQLFSQVDELGLIFVLDQIYEEDRPEDSAALVLFLLRRFLEEFGDVTEDDELALVTG